MAKFRKVYTAFWDDTYMEKLSPEDRYFYLFLLTNPLCTECGIYSISVKKISYYTGYNHESVMTLLSRFKDAGKIFYDIDSSEIAIVKKLKYLDRLGKPIMDCLKSELSNVKNIEYIRIIGLNSDSQQVKDLFHDTWTIRCKEITIRGQEEEKEEEKEEDLNDDTWKIKKWEEMIVLEMIKIWKEKFPSYFLEPNNDYPSCLQIAYKIAADKKISHADVVYKSEKLILESWRKIAEYIPTNSHYRKLSLTQIEKQFSGLKQAMIADKTSPPKKKEEPKEHKENYVTQEDIDKYRKK